MANTQSRPATDTVVGRLAPTPSAGIHVGNVFSCLVAWLAARSAGGRVLLRIEDVDKPRCKQTFIDGILRDLDTLGITWDNADIMYQSMRSEAYDAAFEKLRSLDVLYPCFCSRADLHVASAPHVGEHYIYAGTCRELSADEIAERTLRRSPAYRLRVPDDVVCITDEIQGTYSQNLAGECGDYVLRRSDGIYSYQLAVVVDDLEQGVNQVVRGLDLLECAPQQSYLRGLLCPDAADIEYAHIPMIVDSNGRRLAKRDRDMSLPAILEHFETVEAFIGYLAYTTGLQPVNEPTTAENLAKCFSYDLLEGKTHITWRLPDSQ